MFNGREQTALDFAAGLTRNSNGIGDDLFERLKGHFEEGEIVEIAAVAALFNYFNTFNNALRVEPTR